MRFPSRHHIFIRPTALLWCLVLAVVAHTSRPAFAQNNSEKLKLGITVSAVINASPEVGARVSSALAKSLAKSLDVTVVEGEEADALLPEAARSQTCLGDPECLFAAGRALGVEQLLVLIVVGVGDELKIEATWVGVVSKKTALRAGITSGNSRTALEASFLALAHDLLPGVPDRVDRPRETRVIKQPTTETAPAPTASSNRHKLLLLGGGAAVASWLAYGTFRTIECGGFGACASDRPKLDIGVDVLGVLGAAVLGTGIYLHMRAPHDSDRKPTPPVALSFVKDSFGYTSLGFTMAGTF